MTSPNTPHPGKGSHDNEGGMMYSKPKGKELVALRRIRKLVSEIEAAQGNLHFASDEILDDRYDGEYDIRISSWKTTSGFALDGVRTNGLERLTSIANFIIAVRRMRRNRASVQRNIDKALRKADRLLATLERIVAPFKLCEVCEGRKGKYIPRQKGQTIIKRWHDCTSCDGRGVQVPRGKP